MARRWTVVVISQLKRRAKFDAAATPNQQSGRHEAACGGERCESFGANILVRAMLMWRDQSFAPKIAAWASKLQPFVTGDARLIAKTSVLCVPRESFTGLDSAVAGGWPDSTVAPRDGKAGFQLVLRHR